MQVAIVLYPGFTALDVIGPYEVLGRLPDSEVVFVAERPGLVRNDLGSLSVDVVASLADVPNGARRRRPGAGGADVRPEPARVAADRRPDLGVDGVRLHEILDPRRRGSPRRSGHDPLGCP